MASPLLAFPEALLDVFVEHALDVSPSLRLAFLSELGSQIHTSSVRAIYSTLVIPDDDRIWGASEPLAKSILAPLCSNPSTYARCVKKLAVCDARGFEECNRLCSKSVLPTDSTEEWRPLDASRLESLLAVCENLEEFTWESSCVPPDGICEVLSCKNARLARFSYIPDRQSHTQRGVLPKWDALSLPLFSTLPLISIKLHGLSQAGAWSFSTLLTNLGEFSSLEDVDIDFVWLDDSLCEKIVEAGRRLRWLCLGTSGTKLTDRGMTAIIEGCDLLEDITLREVQGRLSRSLWSKPEAFPSTLKSIKVAINEVGPHHSWTTDHLQSIHSAPLDTLTKISVMRLEPLPRLQGAVPIYDGPGDDLFALKPVPSALVDTLKDSSSLTVLECDWWAWSTSDLKIVLENCSRLEAVKICLDEPFSKLLSLTSTFSSANHLRSLSVSITPQNAPGNPPVPLLPTAESSLPTPTESPVLRAKSILPQLLDYDQMQTQTSLPSKVAGDPSMPLTRDIKKFVRKCPQLSKLEWFGKNGRGCWTIKRPLTTSKISINVSVDYHPPALSGSVWKAMMWRLVPSEPTNAVERSGHSWEGDAADTLSAERQLQQDRDKAPESPRSGRTRESHRKAKLSVSSANGNGDVNLQLPSPSPSAHSLTPTQPFSPFSPTQRDAEASTLTSVSEDAVANNVLTESTRSLHKRTPSTPALRTKKSAGSRSRSATTTAQEPPDAGSRSGYFNGAAAATPVVNGSAATTNGSKPARGRGGRGGRGGKRQNTPHNAGGAEPSVNGAGGGGKNAAGGAKGSAGGGTRSRRSSTRQAST